MTSDMESLLCSAEPHRAGDYSTAVIAEPLLSSSRLQKKGIEDPYQLSHTCVILAAFAELCPDPGCPGTKHLLQSSPKAVGQCGGEPEVLCELSFL